MHENLLLKQLLSKNAHREKYPLVFLIIANGKTSLITTGVLFREHFCLLSLQAKLYLCNLWNSQYFPLPHQQLLASAQPFFKCLSLLMSPASLLCGVTSEMHTFCCFQLSFPSHLITNLSKDLYQSNERCAEHGYLTANPCIHSFLGQ